MKIHFVFYKSDVGGSEVKCLGTMALNAGIERKSCCRFIRYGWTVNPRDTLSPNKTLKPPETTDLLTEVLSGS